MGPIPTGALHVVPLDDVFFSTTDAKGVIDEANEVFRRNARHTREELIGAPHNLIRHPEMPGAVFKLMWDMLEAGSPVCAYVLNLAGDGSAYWAFATVVPIGDRYLSVRTNPCNLEARDLVYSLYQAVREAEQQARADGASAREAAELGVDVLSNALVDNGFGSYVDFQADLVPVEVAAREALGPSQPQAADAPLVVRVLLSDVRELRSRLDGFSSQLGSSLQAADVLARDSRRCGAGVAAVRESLSALVELTDPRPDAAELDRRLAAAVDDVGHLQERLDEVVRARKKVNLSTAIARLQAEAIARYVVAAADAVEDPSVSHRALTSLTEALFAILTADITADVATSQAFREEVAGVIERVDGLRDEVSEMAAAEAFDVEPTGGAETDTTRSRLALAQRQLELDLDSVHDLAGRVAWAAASFAGTSAGLDRVSLAELLGEIIERSAKV